VGGPGIARPGDLICPDETLFYESAYGFEHADPSGNGYFRIATCDSAPRAHSPARYEALLPPGDVVAPHVVEQEIVHVI
jgi:hypothetical protein